MLIALRVAAGGAGKLPNAYPSFDYQLIAPAPVSRAVSYRLQSYPQHRTDRGAVRRPRGAWICNCRQGAIRAASSWRIHCELARTAIAAYIDAVLDYLRRGGFTYTLEPPLLNLDSVDDLLFHTREGFCGHYASAFVMLMRAGGVPARVVTGYLGGIWNRYGEYLYITPVRRSCLGRGLARRPGLGASRSDRGRGAGTPDGRARRSAAGRSWRSPATARLGLDPGHGAGLAGAQRLVAGRVHRFQLRPAARAAWPARYQEPRPAGAGAAAGGGRGHLAGADRLGAAAARTALRPKTA